MLFWFCCFGLILQIRPFIYLHLLLCLFRNVKGPFDFDPLISEILTAMSPLGTKVSPECTSSMRASFGKLLNSNIMERIPTD